MQFKLLAQRSQSLVFTQRGQSHWALNSALNTRRVRRPDDLLMMSSCPGIFAVAKNHNNELIWPVQLCRATSIGGGASSKFNTISLKALLSDGKQCSNLTDEKPTMTSMPCKFAAPTPDACDKSLGLHQSNALAARIGALHQFKLHA